GLSFAIPRPLSFEMTRPLLYLEELPGQPLSERIGDLPLDDALCRLGAVHRELHELEVHGVEALGTAHWVGAAAEAAAQIGMLVPSADHAAGAAAAALAANAPSGGELRFSQGDFMPSQILCDDTAWAVLDFDDGHAADPL